MNKKIVFCFPCKLRGGVSNQFLRMATYLQSVGHDVSLVDYRDGVMGSESEALGLSLLPYSDKESVDIPGDSLLVFQSMNPWTIFKNLKVPEDVMMFFWTCHPDNFTLSVPGLRALFVHPRYGKFLYKFAFPVRYRQMRKFVNALDAKGSLAFIDAPCRFGVEQLFDLKFRDDYIPVPISNVVSSSLAEDHGQSLRVNEKFCQINGDGKEKIIMGWVGRIADFKYPILKHTIGRLSTLLSLLDLDVHFHIIGDGYFLQDLKAYTAQFKNIEFTFHGELDQSGVKKALSNDMRLVFAMGTSALEAASNGVPTVLLNFSFDEIAFHKYEWLHLQQGFSVGAKIDGKKRMEDDGLEAILHDFLENEEQLKVLSSDYVVRNHAVASVCQRFLNKAASSRFLISELLELRISKPPIAYRLYKNLQS